jgi:hypothetical protein
MTPAELAHTIRPFILITEVDDGRAFAEHIFQRKFRQSAPDFAHHIVAFYRHREDHLVPLSYVHFTQHSPTLMLAGGGCTDGRAFALMSEAQRAQVNAAGGLLAQTQLHGFAKFADRCEAFGGYCGDARASVVHASVGYEPTPYEHLIVKWHKPLPASRRLEIIETLHAIGPF